VMRLKRDVSSMRRVLVPQRDAIGRLARREFPAISDEMAYRFRDVYDHAVRLTEEAILFQDRITGIFEVNLSSVSNRLNQVMKLLTVMSTIFLPLTVLTGMWGMNITIPHFPGGPEVQFWWIFGLMFVICVAMLVFFRRNKWL
jgi:magnesium transporter